MGNILERAFLNISAEKRSASPSGMFPFFGFGKAASAPVNQERALTIGAFYNAVDQITNDLAKLPKAVYKKTENGREKLSSHPVSYLINREPNSDMTAFMFWKMMIQAAILRGNGIAIIHRNSKTGMVESLEFSHPDDLRDIKKVNGILFYYLKDRVYHQADVLHIPGYSSNGIYGVSVIAYAAQTLDIALNAQIFTSENFQDRGLGFGAIESEKPIDVAVKKMIEQKVDAKLSSPGKIRTVVLDEGMQYKSISITPQEAQIIDQGKISVLDICRFLNINPHKVKMLDDSNYSVLELLSIEHASDSIMPWSIKFQQECDRKLFTEKEKETDHYIWFNDNILLRADLKAKGEYYSKMLTSGALTRNEVRGFEEMNALPGLDEPLTPVNTQTTEQIQKKLKENE